MMKVQGSMILPIILLLLIILAIVFGNHIFRKFSEPFTSNKCNYYPWGPTVESCSNNCISNDRVGLWDIDGRQCNKGICDKICASCTNLDTCQWVNTWSPEELKKLEQKNNTVLSKLVPKKLQISGISYPDTAASESYDDTANIKLFWQNYGDSENFMVHYFNMNATEDFIKVKSITNKNESEYELSRLNSNSEYSIILYAINEYGISEPSNIIIVKT